MVITFYYHEVTTCHLNSDHRIFMIPVFIAVISYIYNFNFTLFSQEVHFFEEVTSYKIFPKCPSYFKTLKKLEEAPKEIFFKRFLHAGLAITGEAFPVTQKMEKVKRLNISLTIIYFIPKGEISIPEKMALISEIVAFISVKQHTVCKSECKIKEVGKNQIGIYGNRDVLITILYQLRMQQCDDTGLQTSKWC